MPRQDSAANSLTEETISGECGNDVCGVEWKRGPGTSAASQEKRKKEILASAAKGILRESGGLTATSEQAKGGSGAGKSQA